MEWLVTRPIAHRGLHNHRAEFGKVVPENSLAACQAAIEENTPIEIDVHLTAEGEILVFHDYFLKRLTGQSGTIKKVKIDNLGRYQLLNTAETIPTLQDVLTLVGGQVPLLIELKTRDRKGIFANKILEELEGYKGEFALQSFNPFVVSWFHKNKPEINVGQLVKGFKLLRSLARARFNPFDYFMGQLNCKPDFIGYDIDNLNALTSFFWRQRKLPLIVWTVRTKDQEETAKKHADNFIFEHLY